MNIADEIAFNTMRYTCSSETATAPRYGGFTKYFKGGAGANSKIKLGSFATILPGGVHFFIFQPGVGVTAEIYKDDEYSSPVVVLDRDNTYKNIDVLPFHKYTIYLTNNSPATIKNQSVSVGGTVMRNDDTFAII